MIYSDAMFILGAYSPVMMILGAGQEYSSKKFECDVRNVLTQVSEPSVNEKRQGCVTYKLISKFILTTRRGD